jgi:uncharacterized OsmC-like protein
VRREEQKIVSIWNRQGGQELTYPKVSMKERQLPLTDRYKLVDDAAIVIDSARTSSADVPASHPLQTVVTICDENPEKMPVGVHEKVGGDSDYPTPGDILCGAIAACLDSTIRVVCNRVNIKLKHLEVEVLGTVDVRGTLRVSRSVPVAFQKFDVTVTMKASALVPGKVLDKILKGAEHSCIVIQTVRQGAEVTVTRT